MLHTSQKLKNNTSQCWIFFQSLLVNLSHFFDENSKQILTIFILLLLAGQAIAVLNPVARRLKKEKKGSSPIFYFFHNYLEFVIYYKLWDLTPFIKPNTTLCQQYV